MVCLRQTVRTVPYAASTWRTSSSPPPPTSSSASSRRPARRRRTSSSRWSTTPWATSGRCPRSQLYAEPARLARAGYLTEGQEPDGRRRKQYALTERGQEALQRWTGAPAHERTELRDLAYLKLFFGADPAAMAEAQLGALRALLQLYETMLAGATSRTGPAGPARRSRPASTT